MHLYLQTLGKPFIKNVKSYSGGLRAGFTRINRRFTSAVGVIGLVGRAHTIKKTHGHCIGIHKPRSDEAKADAAFYAILTADQQTKYNQLHSVGLGGRGGPAGGFGGRGLGSFGAIP